MPYLLGSDLYLVFVDISNVFHFQSGKSQGISINELGMKPENHICMSRNYFEGFLQSSKSL